jgi:hypothetical protein
MIFTFQDGEYSFDFEFFVGDKAYNKFDILNLVRYQKGDIQSINTFYFRIVSKQIQWGDNFKYISVAAKEYIEKTFKLLTFS